MPYSDDISAFFARVGSVGALRLLSLAVQFAFSLVNVRILLSEYGHDGFGAITLVSTLIALVPIADFGLGTALTNRVASAAESGRFDGLRHSLSAVTWVLVGVALVLVAGGAVLSGAGVWSAVLGDASTLIGDPDDYMPPYVAACAFWLVSTVGSRLLIGLGRANTLTMLQSGGAILATIATAASAWSGAPAVVCIYYPVIGATLVGVAAWVITARRFPTEARGLAAPWTIARAEYRATLVFGGAGFLFTLGTFLLLALDRILLSQFSSPAELARYALAVPLFGAVQATLEAMGTYLWPYYERARIRREFSARIVHRDALAFAGAGALAAVLIWFTMPLYALVIGAPPPSQALTLALALLAVAQSIVLAYASALTRHPMLAQQGLALLVGVALKVLLAPLVLPWLGATGVVCLSIVSILAVQAPALLVLLGRAYGRMRPADAS